MHIGSLWQLSDWVSLPLLGLLAAVLLWRNVVYEFPHFVNYIIASELIGVARLLTDHYAHKRYFYTYWISDVLMAILALLATYELGFRRLFPNFHKIRFYQYLFAVAGVVIAWIAGTTAIHNQRLETLLIFTNVLDLFRVSILLFFVSLMIFMGRVWSRHELGIALGLAVDSAAVLANFAVWKKTDYTRTLLDQISVVGFDIACLIWLVYLLRPEKHASAPETAMDANTMARVKDAKTSLKQWVSRKK